MLSQLAQPTCDTVVTFTVHTLCVGYGSESTPKTDVVWMKFLCDTHAHTVASTHAYSTVHDYFSAASARGLQLIAITDHAPAMPDAPHYWHFGNMKVVPRVDQGVAMLRGIEANILPAGRHEVQGHKDLEALDIPPNLEPFLDLTIASFHEPVFHPSSVEDHTRAAIAAITSGKCQVLGHPGNPNFPLNYEEVVRAARDNNVLIEMNNSSFTHSRIGSEPVCLGILEIVERLNWKITVASDAHIATYIGDHQASINHLLSIGFPEAAVVSATPQRLLDFLAEHDRTVSQELQPWLTALKAPVEKTKNPA